MGRCELTSKAKGTKATPTAWNGCASGATTRITWTSCLGATCSQWSPRRLPRRRKSLRAWRRRRLLVRSTITISFRRNRISLIITENEINYSYKAFPTKYFEGNGKLFYWQDSTEKVSPELISKLAKHIKPAQLLQRKRMKFYAR